MKYIALSILIVALTSYHTNDLTAFELECVVRQAGVENNVNKTIIFKGHSIRFTVNDAKQQTFVYLDGRLWAEGFDLLPVLELADSLTYDYYTTTD